MLLSSVSSSGLLQGPVGHLLASFRTWVSRAPELGPRVDGAASRAVARPLAATRKAPPLRVLQVIDQRSAAAPRSHVRITGRIADVCAELDRMVEHEAALALRA